MVEIEVNIKGQLSKDELDSIVDDIDNLIEHNDVTIWLTNSRLRLIPEKDK